MSEAWAAAIPSVLVGVLLVAVPGSAVIVAGWGVRSLRLWLLAPAVSLAILAGAATAAHLVHMRWSLLPVAIVTLACAGIAFAVRRWVAGPSRSASAPDGTDAPESIESPARWRGWMSVAVGAAGLLGAAITISVQLMIAFGGPENISQTFDNVVHLNAIRLALDSADASVFTIGSTSDTDWYPNGWHSVVTLVAQLGGGSIPLAVNAGTIAICAFAWPASVLALTATVFRGRPAALGAAAALSTGFGAFPLLLVYFGVLYPNATAYAVLPAGVAAVWMLLTAHGRGRVRQALLLALIAAGITMAHPNALLALYALTVVPVIWFLVRLARRGGTRRGYVVQGGWILAILLVGVGLWRFGRTNAAMSAWAAWQSTAQAFGEAALMSPRGYPVTIATAVVLLIGIAAVVRHPSRWWWVGPPFAAAAFLFIVASGVPAGTRLRDLLTSPWYNDSFRLAALLPIVGIPVAVLGTIVIVDAVTACLRRIHAPAAVREGILSVAVAALFGVAVGPNVTAVVDDARTVYRLDASSALLTADEAAVLERLDRTTPPDALLIVNPWTGGSLAFALADRHVTARHIFGTRSADEEFVDAHLAQIDSDPRVCEAVDRIGATYVLDFGHQNVFNNPGSGLERSGLNDLTPSSHLVLVDSQGEHARLFAVMGC
ncbi:hypothetical protein GCM10023065_08500 [Microbacterium laevaniformans]|uniref:DUF6541 family protein n=1 Tax=Microbacterium laevaniformans TaxID=36807 RepID=UPI001959E2F4|nr:DUF6541 family protein [Microbacterium laevaniformans]MBM7751801.1 hypothetical protein [Microbacterium laevaniformans]GLJ63844.1 hypothetical protein GCM10017578_07320 [Microbacterium laevaniformans]